MARPSSGQAVKRCACRDPETGKQLGTRCPELSKRGHGKWWGRYTAPAGPNGKRRRPWVGPFDTKTQALEKVRDALTDADAIGFVPDRNVTVTAYLRGWLDSKKKLKASTLDSYREAVELYYIPALGHLKLIDLRDHHLAELYRAIGQINRPMEDGEQPSEVLRRLVAARALSKRKLAEGEKPSLKRQRPLSAARIRRIHAVISSALGTAKKRKLISVNPADFVELPRVAKTKPQVWTNERVTRWQQTGKRPARVMVWTPQLAGAFLDFCEQREDRLYPLLHLVATRGLRRGEVASALWVDTDLDGAKTMSVLAGPEDDDEGPKTEKSVRTFSLDEANIALLRRWRKQQEAERSAAGEDWIDSGRIFTRPDGSPLREDYLSRHFLHLVEAAGLPPIRFHDLRHCSASFALAAGVDMKVVSATLGHARYSFTADTYTSVVPEVAAAAAEATTAIIPRGPR
ncbi:tyrosine-type recombinase/integrase [Nocardiopsis suaedae]|uniref:Site-specific integrase n=1 Tax=Nocardiopsis suaedae TaxID=3018444 RepID=A0ABT4TM08_9ACTN|nr:site-specific integrase [Nocardiopsis suaedae]MDA2805735.1 site-specific integrase [Nocardiopsis suaedae]